MKNYNLQIPLKTSKDSFIYDMGPGPRIIA